MCVSSSVSRRWALSLARIIGVSPVECHDCYLGLPSFTGRNKKELFHLLRTGFGIGFEVGNANFSQ